MPPVNRDAPAPTSVCISRLAHPTAAARNGCLEITENELPVVRQHPSVDERGYAAKHRVAAEIVVIENRSADLSLRQPRRRCELGSFAPDLQCALAGNVVEILVARQHRQIVVHAKLGQEPVDRSDLYPGTTTPISQHRCCNVILAIRHQ